MNLRKGTGCVLLMDCLQELKESLFGVRNDRRVVVSIEGVMAVATTFIHPSFVEPIDK